VQKININDSPVENQCSGFVQLQQIESTAAHLTQKILPHRAGVGPELQLLGLHHCAVRDVRDTKD